MQIHRAASIGDNVALRHELESGVPVDSLDSQNLTPLMLAASSSESNSGTVQLLVEWGADPNAIGGEYHKSVLIQAVGAGDPVRVKCLLDAGAEINTVYGGGVNILIQAMYGRSISHDERLMSLVNLLLERGASAQGKSAYGESALSAASQNGRFDVVKRLLEAGADETLLEWTPLMRSIAIGTLDEVRKQIAQGASLSDRDDWKRTPWLLSLSVGDIEKSKLLLAAGANRDDTGHCGKPALFYPIESNRCQMLHWLIGIGCDVDATNEFKDTPLMEAASQESPHLVQLLLDAGADPDKADNTKDKAIARTPSIEVIRLLLAAGQYLEDINPETRALVLGLEYEGDPVISREEFEESRHRHFGTTNPEKMEIPFWRAMVQCGARAFSARQKFTPYDEIFEGEDGKSPVWCHNRFGMSLTELPDGRLIEIGGEHEDWYDPDFCIYNEVFVHHPNDTFEIWGYSDEVFPPTDFHTATLVENFIYILGCMGYPNQRVVGYTPVYRLNLETMAIEKVETSGDNPGWISRHKAVLVGDEIHISGEQNWTEPEESSEDEECGIAEEATIPMEEDFASTNEWMAALDQYLEANKIEEYQSPERFILDLKSLQWRRDLD